MIKANDARHIARSLLKSELPRRWAHTKRVARNARSLAQILGDDAEVVETAAWLHDIGYASSVASTAFHPVDGARYLRDALGASPLVCQLVAHHTGASVEAEERGMAAVVEEFPTPPMNLLDAVTYCDLTASVDGAKTTVDSRLAEIFIRYSPDHVVHQSITRSAPTLLRSVYRVEARLAASSVKVRVGGSLEIVVNPSPH
ncbi:HD domain-containing protein [Kribbella deserti]|uniref:HD domain-containing protein n=1 Tax=Kribbella deserti TaxID=1926257 RepID=A0ABV6QS31_9ACTN